MPKPVVWNIYKPDGLYLGQYSAFAPSTALAHYRSLLGESTLEHDIYHEVMDEGRYKLTYDSEDFHLVPAN